MGYDQEKRIINLGGSEQLYLKRSTKIHLTNNTVFSVADQPLRCKPLLKVVADILCAGEINSRFSSTVLFHIYAFISREPVGFHTS